MPYISLDSGEQQPEGFRVDGWRVYKMEFIAWEIDVFGHHRAVREVRDAAGNVVSRGVLEPPGLAPAPS